ncbi:MAG: hypothetical protein ACLPN2_07945 [Terriglobales bacterium]
MSDVYMRSGEVGGWGKVVEYTPTGMIVQSDPVYGDVLIRFDKNGTACDSSDIDVDRYKDIPLFDYDKTGYLAATPCDDVVDVERVKAVASRYVDGASIPNASSLRGGDRGEFRQHFWENFECLKKHSRYNSKIPGASSGPGSAGPWKLYRNISDAFGGGTIDIDEVLRLRREANSNDEEKH